MNEDKVYINLQANKEWWTHMQNLFPHMNDGQIFDLAAGLLRSVVDLRAEGQFVGSANDPNVLRSLYDIPDIESAASRQRALNLKETP